MKIVLIKHGGPSKVPTIKEACRLGEVLVVDDDPQPACDVPLLQVESMSVASVLDILQRSEQRPDAVLTFVDPVILVASAVANQLGLPALPPENAAVLKDKLRMRDVLRSEGIHYPAYSSFADETDLPSAARQVGLPLVLKPASGGAYSLGVIRIDHAEVLVPRFREARKELVTSQFSRFFSGGPRVSWMVESYMVGVEISVELMGLPDTPIVLAVHEKVMTESGGHFREDRFVTAPYHLKSEQLQRVRDDAVKVAKALKFSRGVAHLEMRVTEQGAFPIEMQAVPGGAMVSEMTELSRGVNLHALHTRSFLANEVEPPAPTSLGFCAMDVLYAERPGTYRISGMEAAGLVPGIERVVVPAADAVTVSQPFSEYLGFVLSCGASAGEALGLLDQAREELRIEQIDIEP